MLFNSIAFLIFFPVVTAMYFVLPYRWRAPMLLAASCVFYMAFVPAYILILGFTIVVDYAAGLWIERSDGAARRTALITSLIANIGVLAMFKYYNFIAGNVRALSSAVSAPVAMPLLQIVLPIGLSFHTFQAMSYTIEVFRRQHAAERNLLRYALYVMFYPQLVAGPIERPQRLLPQFREVHQFDYERVASGLLRMSLGFFKKLVIADGLAIYVNLVYEHPESYHGLALIVATVFFAFQIYWDFSGYSDIALGAAQVMGFRLMENFRRPYAAPDIAEFWQRWHISLSTWFRDYVYIPLGGNRVSPVQRSRNVMIVFLLSGLWHGASWTFVVWGAIHGTMLVVGDATRATRNRLSAQVGWSRSTAIGRACSIGTTFAIVTIAWVFFRATTFSSAWYVLTHMGVGVVDDFRGLRAGYSIDGVIPGAIAWRATLIAVMLTFEYLSDRWAGGDQAAAILRAPLPLRYATYFTLIYVSLFRSGVGHPQFIYFQF